MKNQDYPRLLSRIQVWEIVMTILALPLIAVLMISLILVTFLARLTYAGDKLICKRGAKKSSTESVRGYSHVEGEGIVNSTPSCRAEGCCTAPICSATWSSTSWEGYDESATTILTVKRNDVISSAQGLSENIISTILGEDHYE